MGALDGLRLVMLGNAAAARRAAEWLAARGVEQTMLDPEPPFDSDEGRGRLLAQVRRSDFLIEALGPGGLERAGAGPESLFAEQPALVVIRFRPDDPGDGQAFLLEALAAFVRRQRSGVGGVVE